MVNVSPRHVGQAVEARVSGSGMGIPERVRAKLFQPCFLAKPMEEGTGIGLSLSHDSSAQGPGGALTAGSREGAGTEFTSRFPVA